jgi:tetratricopeptide (TPR) repeat protein/predicted Ser/Thr protein kinase
MAQTPPPASGGSPGGRETWTYEGGAAAPPRIEASSLERGSTVHRYVILDRVGEGGMGVVYAAYDPRLDRRVALKFLSRRGSDERLLREAQAMARLSHPNVAVAYEVGYFGGHLFLAMEFVDGVNLRRWLAEKPRSRSRILEVFLAAGRGLAAAHASGIVHRDFKPENVLIGADDRPRVTDFGLARASRDPEDDEVEPPQVPGADSPDPLSTPSHLSIQLTRTGGFVGTPGYMPPEQIRGDEVDARADQFGFCAALFEALTGARPFGGGSPAEIAEAMIAQRIDPAATTLPRRLRPIIMRGLEPDPGDRWPSMDALLEALSRDPRAARRFWLAGGAAAIGLATVASIWLAGREAIELCPPARDRIAGIWDVPARKQVRAAFLATGAARAADVFERVERSLDARLSDWVDAHREACRATRVRGEQSEALLDLRMQCLERSRRKIQALPEVWREGVVLDEAVRAALTVGEVEGCSDVEALTTPIARPSRPDALRRLQALERLLDRVDTIRQAGKLEAALKAAREAVAEARRLGYPPVLAEALHRNGQVEADFGSLEAGVELLHQAFEAANQAHDDARAATVMRLVLFYSVWSDKRLADADLLWKMAEAAVARVPHRDDLAAELLATQGSVLSEQGKHAEAAEHLRRAIALRRKQLGDDDFPVTPWVYNLAAVLADMGQTDEAFVLNERAQAAWEHTLGAEHPFVAEALSNLTVLLIDKGDPDAAAVPSERALAIRSQIFPADHPVVAKAVYNLGLVRRAQERDEEARTLFERAARIREKALGPEHPLLATTLNHLADLAIRRGDAVSARRFMDRALPIKIKTYGGAHETVAAAMRTLGDLHLLEKHPAAARDAYQRSHAILVEQSRDDPDLVPVLTGLGRAQLELGLRSEAVATLERAVERADARGPATRLTGARARFQLARALWASGETARAASLARAARDQLAGRRDEDEIDRWLVRHAAR